MIDRLYHYTCDDGARAIMSDDLMLKPGALGLLWLTDLDVPYRDALGLTSHSLNCDRTKHRFEVLGPIAVHHWMSVRLRFNRDWVAGLEAAPGAMPMHWFVTSERQAAFRSIPAELYTIPTDPALDTGCEGCE